MKICHNMNIIVQTTCGDEPSLNGIIKTHNNTIANVGGALRRERW